MSTSLVDECCRRAGEARRSAEMASMPSQKTHFLGLEKRVSCTIFGLRLSAARNHRHLRGFERTVPLRLSNEVIAALAVEAQLREMSLGQLVGEIVISAVATGVSGLLDGKLSSVDAA
jgi:hypothetical protein